MRCCRSSTPGTGCRDVLPGASGGAHRRDGEAHAGGEKRQSSLLRDGEGRACASLRQPWPPELGGTFPAAALPAALHEAFVRTCIGDCRRNSRLLHIYLMTMSKEAARREASKMKMIQWLIHEEDSDV